MFNDAKFIANPYPIYDELRSGGSIHYFNSSEGAWLLPRHADVVNALHDNRLSARRSHLIVNRLPLEVRGEFTEFNRIIAMWMAFHDAPEHHRLRRLLNQGFKPYFLQAMRPRIQKIADFLLDRVQENGHMEFMRDFAYPFPVLVITEMLGINPSDQAKFIAWSDDVVTFMGPKPTVDVAWRAQNSLNAIIEYFRALLPERRKNPGDDLISLLIRAEEQGNMLTSDQLLAQCSMLLITGHEAPRSFLGNGLLTLLQHPDQLQMLMNNPALMPKAVGELLRYDSPIKFIARPAVDELNVHNHHIQPGQIVYALIGSANRDPAKFPNPDAFDVSRDNGLHLSFGSGPHFCLGATLACLEAEIAFNTVLRRLPNLRLVNPIPDWLTTVALRALRSLPLTF